MEPSDIHKYSICNL